jgi:hypothetical protein
MNPRRLEKLLASGEWAAGQQRVGLRALTRNAASEFNPVDSTRRARSMKFLRNPTRIDAARGFEKRVNAQSRWAA